MSKSNATPSIRYKCQTNHRPLGLRCSGAYGPPLTCVFVLCSNMRNKSHDGALYLRASTVSIVGQGQPISVVNCSRVAGDEPAHLSPQTRISREKPDQSALSAVTTLGAAPRLHSSAGAYDRSEVLAAALMHGLGLALLRLRTRVQRVGRAANARTERPTSDAGNPGASAAYRHETRHGRFG